MKSAHTTSALPDGPAAHPHLLKLLLPIEVSLRIQVEQNHVTDDGGLKGDKWNRWGMLWVGAGRGESHGQSHARDRDTASGGDGGRWETPLLGQWKQVPGMLHIRLPEARKLQMGSGSQLTDQRKRASSVLTVPRNAMPVPKLTAAGIMPNFPA